MAKCHFPCMRKGSATLPRGSSGALGPKKRSSPAGGKRDVVQRCSESDFRHAIFPDLPCGTSHASEDAQWRAIRFLFGQVTLRAQAYEDALARFVVTARGLEDRASEDEERIWRLTLGKLQKEYRTYCLLEPAHLERMARALEIRNSLAHNFYRRRMHLLETAEGRESVIEELQAAEDFLRSERDDVYWNLHLLTGIELL